MSFKDFNFKTFIQEALDEIKFKEPTPVQQKLIPVVRSGRDLVGESKTGSGKTHTFLLPIFEKLNPKSGDVQVVITAPSRELATQIYQATKQIAKHSDTEIRVVNYVGGTDKQRQIEKLKVAQPHIVIGTIGRLMDLVIDANVLKIHNAQTVVIDEADMIFEEKELIEVDKIMAKVQGKPQFLIFSATIPKGLRHFLNKYLENVKTIVIKEKNLTTANIEHLMLQCKAKDKEKVLLQLLHIIHPFLAIVFVNTKEQVEKIAMLLSKEGFKIGKLHGAMEDRIRKQMLKRINALEYQYIVASDIAARGIDIKGVSHIINFDLPNDIEFYIHRTGRTARYNNTGYAYSLYAYEDDDYIKNLQNKGLKPKFVKIQNNEIVETNFFVKKEKGFIKTIENQVHSSTKMPKKVKPGYRKKRLEEINKKIKKIKKEHINEIYRKKAKAERGK